MWPAGALEPLIDTQGRRRSLDVVADSSYDAAHVYLDEAKKNRNSGLPIPTRETQCEVIADGKLHRVTGQKLREWIDDQRGERNGPRGYLFSKRAVMD